MYISVFKLFTPHNWNINKVNMENIIKKSRIWNNFLSHHTNKNQMITTDFSK
jgi:hypothetical protein